MAEALWNPDRYRYEARGVPRAKDAGQRGLIHLVGHLFLRSSVFTHVLLVAIGGDHPESDGVCLYDYDIYMFVLCSVCDGMGLIPWFLHT